jgi:hypothetical protein
MNTLHTAMFLLLPLLLSACSSSIDLPVPEELQVKQIAPPPQAMVELSWRHVVRVDGYLIHYDVDGPGEPFEGKGLQLVRWPNGCGDFDGGTLFKPDVGTQDAGGAPESQYILPADSPINIPEQWCLDRLPSYTDLGTVAVQTPSTRPRIRLAGLAAQQRYFFAVQVFRNAAQSPLSAAVSYTVPGAMP